MHADESSVQATAGLTWQETVTGGDERRKTIDIDFEEETPTVVAGSDVAASGMDAETSSTLRVRTDTPCRLLVDGSPAGHPEPGAPHVVSVEPGEHWVRAEKLDGTTAWEQTVLVEAETSTEMAVAFSWDGPVGSNGRWRLRGLR